MLYHAELCHVLGHGEAAACLLKLPFGKEVAILEKSPGLHASGHWCYLLLLLEEHPLP